MLKKTFKYPSLLDGSEIVEEFYFHLNPVDLAELERRHEGGYQAHVLKVGETDSFAPMFDVLQELIELSVGRRSEDGKRFIKGDEVVQDFMQSPAHEQLFMEFLESGPAKVVEFFNGVMPAGLVDKVEKTGDLELPAAPEDDRPAWIRDDREPTQREIQSMDPDQLREAFVRRAQRQATQPS